LLRHFLDFFSQQHLCSMRSLVFGALAVAATASPPSIQDLFEDFIEKYDRDYQTASEKEARFHIFSENMEMIEASNAKIGRTYTLGLTPNTDRTFEEWHADHNSGLKPDLTASKGRDVFIVPDTFAEPDSIDWVAKGAVTSIKNQGTCGSCWAFSTVGGLEGALLLAGRPLEDLSMQHILGCDNSKQYGCNGGLMDQAFDWVAQNGITALKDEPYLCENAQSSQCTGMTCMGGGTNKTDEVCNIFTRACSSKYGSTTCGHEAFMPHCECQGGLVFADGACGPAPAPATLALKPGDVSKHTDVDTTENALEAAVAQQPVSVAIEADKPAFQHYTHGVITSDACGSTLDHGVLAVGYGVDNGQAYWKLKNSWGTEHGENGYYRIAKGKAGGGECGIRKSASFPTLKSADVTLVV